ncbi:hypothetical protein ABIE62_000468 [Porphyrobacter sp. MBR-155]|jgi:hypothetical protein|uniref:hypothetical protein n=1 Tax=Porphyrobacter sp. MBR-155 TaxID=3156464 RepID=UPI003396536E
MFGRKSTSEPGSSPLRDSLDFTNADDMAWVKQRGDPLIWHVVALSMVIFGVENEDFMAWLVEQERMDRVTALAIFMAQSNGKNRLTGGVLPPEDMPEPYRSRQRGINRIIDRLCELDKQRTWPEHGIGLEPGWEEERPKLLAELGHDPRFPRNMFARPIPPQTAKMPYHDIGEAELVSEGYMRKHMPYLLD